MRTTLQRLRQRFFSEIGDELPHSFGEEKCAGIPRWVYCVRLLGAKMKFVISGLNGNGYSLPRIHPKECDVCATRVAGNGGSNGRGD